METLEVIQTVVFFIVSVIILTITGVIISGKKVNPSVGYWHRDNVKDVAKWFSIALFVSSLIGGFLYHYK